MELEFIRWLREHVPEDPRATLGLRDDAAVLSLGSEAIVTTDLLTDGVDFRLEVDDPKRIGRQALGANLSDLAAMAATPVAAFVSLALPSSERSRFMPLDLAIRLYEGLLPLAREFNVAIAGGDTNTFDGALVISVTAIGTPLPNGPLTRGGARHPLPQPRAGDVARRAGPRDHDVRHHARRSTRVRRSVRQDRSHREGP